MTKGQLADAMIDWLRAETPRTRAAITELTIGIDYDLDGDSDMPSIVDADTDN